jgi:hypothetical protein
MRNWQVLPLILIGALMMVGCQAAPQEPTPPAFSAALHTPTATSTFAPVPTPIPSQISSAPVPTSESTLVPGTILAQQTAQIDADAGGQLRIPLGGLSGQAIRVDVVLIEGSVDYHLAIVDPFGNSLATLAPAVGSLADFIAELRLPYDGTYAVTVIPAEGAGTVQVTVSALASTSGGGTLAGPGESITGFINLPNTYHTYQFPLQAGDTVRIAAEAETEGAPDTYLVLLGPDGSLLAEVDDSPSGLDAVLNSFWAETGGTYVAIVSAYGDTAGRYTFSVTPVTAGAAPAPDVFYGSTYTGNFVDGSHLSAAFDGHIGEVLQIEVLNLDPELDIDVLLLSPYGEPLAASASGVQGEDETISEVQLPFEGQYRLELIPAGSGRAEFRITQLTQEQLTGGGSFGDSTGAVRYGAIRAPNTFHTYQFNADAGDSITLTITSTSEQGTLSLGFVVLGPDGRQAASADNFGAGLDPELVDYVPTRTGTYTVIVYSFDDATGTYELQYTRG